MGDDPAIRYLEHDADLGFEVVGATLDEVWDRGARALVGVMTDVARVARDETVELEVTAPDRVAAWVASLAELLVAFELEGWLLPEIEALRIDEGADGVQVRFRARGERYDPARHPGDTAIKAVTHHGAGLDRDARGRWRGRVLLDL